MKAILVDDEKKICMLLRGLVDWHELGIEIVDEAYSGTVACEKIRRQKPDIVVTDIRMPGMDGLEMIRRLKREGLDTEFILISGHKNFEYAHSAIQYGVSNYLLKPLTATDLYDNLLEVSRRILQRRSSASELERLQSRLDYSCQLIGKQFVGRFCAEPKIVSGKSIGAINREYYTNFADGVFAVAQIHLGASRTMSREQNATMLDKVESYFSKRLRSSRMHPATGRYEGRIVLVLNAAERADLEMHLKDTLNDAQRYFSDFCTLVLGLSNFDKQLRPEQVQEAELALCSRLDLGVDRIIRYSECSASTAGAFPASDALKQLLDIVQLADTDRFQGWLKENYESLISRELPPAAMIRGAHALVSTLEGTFASCYKQEMGGADVEEIHGAIRSAVTRDGIVEALAQWIKQRMERHASRMEEQGAHFIRSAQRYIGEHYSEGISLQDVADYVHLNPTYFSTLFKKKQGQGFSEYLISYRIEAAKKLLADPSISIAAVGGRVGYGDAAYFSKLFTKVVGIRPKDFRKLCL